MSKTAIVTGSSGFIGFFVSKLLLDKGWKVTGIDNLNEYYDVELKLKRQQILLDNKNFSIINKSIESQDVILGAFKANNPDLVIHLAAQAGVRNSIENPGVYLESNINGSFKLLEASKVYPPKHLLMASTSSAYGFNKDMPYKEMSKSDFQLSFYAATKKSMESMAHSYSHIYELPITIFRFFTVYGPWGRPDMALFKFTKAIMSGQSVDIFNYGNMKRDFTYIEDLVHAIYLLIDKAPSSSTTSINHDLDTLSPVAPYRIVNIGNSRSEKLLDFVEILEEELGKKANRNLLPMQMGDVKDTWADSSLLKSLTGYVPKTNIKEGIREFVRWYQEFYCNE